MFVGYIQGKFDIWPLWIQDEPSGSYTEKFGGCSIFSIICFGAGTSTVAEHRSDVDFCGSGKAFPAGKGWHLL
jgi:hypothetical protein